MKISVTHHLNKTMGVGENTLISIDTEKASEENSTPFYDKNTQQTKNGRKLSQHDKGHYEKPTVNPYSVVED